MRTQVGIIGAGPAGLMLSHLLAREGIESIVIEDRGRDYVEHRVRAGVLEQGTVDLMRDTGLGARLEREGLIHNGINIQFDGRRHPIPMSELTGGRAITIYGQQEVVKDLIATRLADGGQIEFEVDDVRLADLDTDRPRITYTRDGEQRVIECDFVAGCDGAHGVSRSFVPPGILHEFRRDYPFAWLGILAQVAPSTDWLVYAYHERGFALHSLRSPSVSRLYVQVQTSDSLDNWPDDRIWAELQTRLELPGWTLHEGPVIAKDLTVMRSLVTEPMQWGRLFLAGDAAHIVPATGAKGLNLAIADVRVLTSALTSWYRSGDPQALAAYTAQCLRRVWRVQDFSWYMSSMLHRFPAVAGEDGEYLRRLQRSQLDWLVNSEAASRSLSENYVGLPFDWGAGVELVAR